MIELNKIYNEDCLEGMKRIPDKSVDMILCDLPYGTTACKWDTIIPFEPLWEQYERVIKDNGAIVLTASQPFTSVLITSRIQLYKYSWVWEKTKVGGVFNAKNRPLKVHEDIVVFSKSPAANVKGVRMKYNPQGLRETAKLRLNGSRNDGGTIGERPSRRGSYEQKYTGYPKDVLRFSSEGNTIHPTQKPVTLFEYLIETYTDEGDVVLDTCIGSGTTAIACINTNRNVIGFELDKLYYDASTKRIRQHLIGSGIGG